MKISELYLLITVCDVCRRKLVLLIKKINKEQLFPQIIIKYVPNNNQKENRKTLVLTTTPARLDLLALENNNNNTETIQVN